MKNYDAPVSIVVTGQQCAAINQPGGLPADSFDCTYCDKRVHNLSLMTTAEASATLQRCGDGACVVADHDEHGVIRTLDYQSPPPPPRRWRRVALFAATTLAAVGGFLFQMLKPAPPPVPAAKPFNMMSPVAFRPGVGPAPKILTLPVMNNRPSDTTRGTASGR